MAARDFEDLLQVCIPFYVIISWLTPGCQCAIPVFDGLLPEPHNSAILRLLFVCAHWHGLAKLRMHTDATLDILDQTTSRLGAEFRKFTDKTCAAFNTRELPREVEARKRRQLKKMQAHSVRGDTGSSQFPVDSIPIPSAGNGSKAGNLNAAGAKAETSMKNGPQLKKFSLNTYKYHSLGDYASTIRRVGTTDSYSTEPVNVFLSLVWSWSRHVSFRGS